MTSLSFSTREEFERSADADAREDAITRAEDLYFRDGEDMFKRRPGIADWWAEPHLTGGGA
jgi:hypothetical protein